MVQHAVGLVLEQAPRHRQRLFAGVDAVQRPHLRSDLCGPPAAAAAQVEADGIARQLGPGEDFEVLLEEPSALVAGQRLLIEGLPLGSEAGDRRVIEVGHRRRVAHARSAVAAARSAAQANCARSPCSNDVWARNPRSHRVGEPDPGTRRRLDVGGGVPDVSVLTRHVLNLQPAPSHVLEELDRVGQ